MNLQFVIIATAVLFHQVFTTEAWSRGNKNYPHDVKTQSGLTDIYNERVVSASRMSRPLSNWEKEHGKLRHEGIKVTTDRGNQYLVHKGPDFGKSRDTVVVDTKHMKASRWTERETIDVGKRASVSDFVRSGGENRYNFLSDNCQDATKRGMDMAKQRQRGH